MSTEATSLLREILLGFLLSFFCPFPLLPIAVQATKILITHTALIELTYQPQNHKTLVLVT